MKGLIIKPKWADLILNGEKTIEVRGNNTKIRGTIGIIKSGSKKVFGTVDLFHCISLDKEKFELWKDRHIIFLRKEIVTVSNLINILERNIQTCCGSIDPNIIAIRGIERV